MYLLCLPLTVRIDWTEHSVVDNIGSRDEGQSDRRGPVIGGAVVESVATSGHHQTAQQRRLLHRQRRQATDLRRRKTSADGKQTKADQQLRRRSMQMIYYVFDM